MKCPHCDKPIADKDIAKHFASLGGRKSKTRISPEHQKKMQAGVKKARAKKAKEKAGGPR